MTFVPQVSAHVNMEHGGYIVVKSIYASMFTHHSFVRHAVPKIVVLAFRVLENVRLVLHMLAFKPTEALHNNIN